MSYALGIDLGTTYSSVSVCISGNAEIVKDRKGSPYIPSVVSFQKKEILFGNFAEPKKISSPKVTIYDTKRMLGKKYDDPIIQELKKGWPFELEATENGYIRIFLRTMNRRYEPFEISGEILKYMSTIGNERLKERTKKVVITIPANFGNEQRIQTKKAAEYAGLEIVSILNEPTAAGIAYFTKRKDRNPKGENVLVFDFGGGTLDVSIIFISNEEITVKASDGDMNLGGRDFDENTFNYIIKKYHLESVNNKKKNKIRKEIIEAKIYLSGTETANLNFDFLKDDNKEEEDDDEEEEEDIKYEITLEEFEEVNKDLISKIYSPIERLLSKSKMKKSDINSILKVGGSSHMQFVSRRLKEFIGIEPFSGIDPREAVAIGASIYGEMKIKGKLPKWSKTVELTDICPFSIGTSNDIDGKMTIAIHKGDQYPISKTMKDFRTVLYRQEDFYVDILEGENEMAQDNRLIGHFTISNLPPTEEYLTFNITFSIDENGILSVTAELEEGEAKGSIDIDIKQVKEKNNEWKEYPNEEENEYKLYFTNIIRFLEKNKKELMKNYSDRTIDKDIEKANDYINKYGSNFYDDLDIKTIDFSGGFYEKYRKFFNKNPLPFFLK